MILMMITTKIMTTMIDSDDVDNDDDDDNDSWLWRRNL